MLSQKLCINEKKSATCILTYKKAKDVKKLRPLLVDRKALRKQIK